jgi:hypothetical protein
MSVNFPTVETDRGEALHAIGARMGNELLEKVAGTLRASCAAPDEGAVVWHGLLSSLTGALVADQGEQRAVEILEDQARTVPGLERRVIELETGQPVHLN